jgi:SNF2 family DNA or RNA helicase
VFAKPYQITGTAFLTSRRRALLADDAGLGKSMQMIAAANTIGARRILVIAPAIARGGSWKLQFGEWDITARRVMTYPFTSQKDEIPDGPLVMIVGMEWLSNKARAQQLMAAIARRTPFDVAFVDEAHGVKSPDAARTKAVYGSKLDLKKRRPVPGQRHRSALDRHGNTHPLGSRRGTLLTLAGAVPGRAGEAVWW